MKKDDQETRAVKNTSSIDTESIDQFLSTFIPDAGKAGNFHADADDEGNVLSAAKSAYAQLPKPSLYTAPELTDADREKIERFKSISSEIASSMDSIPIPDLSKHVVDYAEQLNSAQLQAVLHKEGPLMIIAGAGSGKTRTICYRTAYMIERGTPPKRILLLTFTRKASKEMLDRTAALLQDTELGHKVNGGTFHAFANQMLRTYSDLIGVKRNFTILDTVDSRDVISLIKNQIKLKKGRRSHAVPKTQQIHKIIAKASSCRMSIDDIIEKEFDYLIEYTKDIKQIEELYKMYNRAHNQYDYDDLLELLYHHLEKNALFQQKLQQRFTHIIVDEYQDTNAVQAKIVELLAGKSKNVMVVGDDAQSIYAFRGARYENILSFPTTFAPCRVVKVEENYRSRQKLLDFSNGIIDAMQLGYKKRLFSCDQREGLPELHRFFYQTDEADWICNRIEALNKNGTAYKNTAVLFRAGYLSNYVQAEMLKRGIPFVVYGGLKFIERRQVKDMLAYLRILVNPLDGVSWNRILKILPDIGPARTNLIIQTVQQNGGVFSAAPFGGYSFFTELKRLEEMFEKLKDDGKALYDKIMILKEYYMPILKSLEADYRERIDDLDVLAVLAREYTEIDKFLSDLALDPPSNAYQSNEYMDEKKEEDRDYVILSTIHSAKGLEWSHVFVISMLDGVLPGSRSIKFFEELEEERRLFYVACTRAKEGLYLSFPSYIQSYTRYFSLPSRFLSEVPLTAFDYYVGENQRETLTHGG
ncbi:MAG: ATP-dependent helicase [Spirochaetales bacterium]|nr:ATP-dependent helicase [Spirochaetales bacterium]